MSFVFMIQRKRIFASYFHAQLRYFSHNSCTQRNSPLLILDHITQKIETVNFLRLPSKSDSGLPPLVVLAGTGQTLRTFAIHLKQFSEGREVNLFPR